MLDFSRINTAALANAESICRRIIPGGRVQSGEYVACNPNRADRKPGSFKINLRTGLWADFASGESGGDLIALTAWRFGVAKLRLPASSRTSFPSTRRRAADGSPGRTEARL